MQAVTELIPPKKQRSDAKVDVASALDLKINHNLSYAEIARMQDVSPQAIHQKIKDLIPQEELKDFKEHRADILSGMQLKIISSIDNETLNKAPLASRATAFGIFYDKERLERGLSTSNVSMATMSEDDLNDELRRIDERLRAIDITPEDQT